MDKTVMIPFSGEIEEELCSHDWQNTRKRELLNRNFFKAAVSA
jgi:hypothetical protein